MCDSVLGSHLIQILSENHLVVVGVMIRGINPDMHKSS